MSELLKRSWSVVNLDNIALNIRKIRESLPGKPMILGVVKADAYGHGDKYIARTMIENGVSWLAVSNINEAISLRNQGIHHPILILGVTPVDRAKQLCDNNITQAIFCKEYAMELQKAAKEQNVVVSGHIKVDSGMGRIGFIGKHVENSVDEIMEIVKYENIDASGIFTHFCCSDELSEDSAKYTKNQYKIFKAVCDKLDELDSGIKIHHCCNSGAVVNYPEYYMDMVRPGILEYGVYPSDEIKREIGIKPAMTWYTTIAMVKTVPKGAMISYGRTFTAKKDTVIATIPIGYADGYSRALSNKGCMIVNGHRANVVGRVCMDQLMLDVTGIPNVKAGMSVTIVGEEGSEKITFDDYAKSIGTIAYESMCLVGRRVPRVYVKNGEKIDVIDYVEKCSL